MIVLIDNYDSFTWNLVHHIGELGPEVRVIRNDQASVGEVMDLTPQAIVISPGPCDPDRAGICLPLIEAAWERVPILGVCLGHQAIGQAFGGRVVRAPVPMHGKVSPIRHLGHGIFEGLPDPVSATRYHSLTIEPASVPAVLEVTAWAEDDDVIMGLSHRERPVHGVQFHPESIRTQHGKRMIKNFLNLALVPA